MSSQQPPPDIGDLPLGSLVRFLVDAQGGPSFDTVAARAGMAGSTIANLVAGGNDIGRTPELRTLIGAARALGNTTPWNLYIAAGISLERLGLTGRPSNRDVAAVAMLPPGWTQMDAVDFGAWRSDGAARIAAARVVVLEEVLTAAQTRIGVLEGQLERAKGKGGETTRRPRKTNG